MNCLISIVVPIYNVEKYLVRCIESIINQTYKNIEIILVDDGSPDDSSLICSEYLKKDSRVKVIKKKNGGLSDARNFGIDNSSGEYICFIDADDYVEETYVEKMYSKALETNADLVVCNYDLVYENSFETKINYCYNPSMLITKELAITSIFENYDWQLEVAWTKMYRRSLFDNMRFTKGIIHEDIDLSYRIIDQCNKIYVMKDVLYHYVQRDNSIMHSPSADKERCLISIQKNRFDYLNNAGYSKKIIGMSYFMYINEILRIAKMYGSEGNKEKKKELIKIFSKERGNMRRLLSFKDYLKSNLKYFFLILS